MHTRITDILIKTGRYSLRIAVVRVTPSGEADSHQCCALFNPRAQGRRACPDPAVLPDAGRRGLPLQSAPEPRADPAGRGAGGARGAGAGHRSAGGGAEVQSSLQSVFCSRIYIYLFFFFLFSSTLVMGIFGVSHNTTYTHFGGRILRHTRHAGREHHFLDAGFSPAKRVAPFCLSIHRK